MRQREHREKLQDRKKKGKLESAGEMAQEVERIMEMAI